MVDTQSELSRLLKDHNLTQSVLAKEFKVSASMISQYLSGTYNGDVAEIDRKAKSYIANFIEEESTEFVAVPIIKTTIYKQVFDIARVCHMRRRLGIAYGEAGIGKTIAICDYVKENPGVIFVEADPVYTERDLFRSLYTTLSGEPRGSIHHMFEECVSRLRGTRRMIIVDEAESLPNKALDLLRRVWDKARIGVLMVGKPILAENIRGKQSDFTQLFSRITIAKNLGMLNAGDAEEIVAQTIPESAGLWETYFSASHGLARKLANLLVESITYAKANNKDITAKLIMDSAKTLVV